MPWPIVFTGPAALLTGAAVTLIGVSSFLAGLAVAGERYVVAGFLIATATGVSLWLRHYVLDAINRRWTEALEYVVNMRRNIRALPEAQEAHEYVKKRFITDA